MGRDFRYYGERPARDSALLLKVDDLINIATGTKDENVIDFKMLQFILYILAEHVSILDQMVELRLPRSGELPTMEDEYYDDVKHSSDAQKLSEKETTLRAPGGTQGIDEIKTRRGKDKHKDVKREKGEKNDDDYDEKSISRVKDGGSGIEVRDRSRKGGEKDDDFEKEAREGKDRDDKGRGMYKEKREGESESENELIGKKDKNKNREYESERSRKKDQNYYDSKEREIGRKYGGKLRSHEKFSDTRKVMSKKNPRSVGSDIGSFTVQVKQTPISRGRHRRQGNDTENIRGDKTRRDLEDDNLRWRKKCDTGSKRKKVKGEDEDDEEELKKMRERKESFEAGGLWKCTGRLEKRESFEETEGVLVADSKGNIKFVPLVDDRGRGGKNERTLKDRRRKDRDYDRDGRDKDNDSDDDRDRNYRDDQFSEDDGGDKDGERDGRDGIGIVVDGKSGRQGQDVRSGMADVDGDRVAQERERYSRGRLDAGGRSKEGDREGIAGISGQDDSWSKKDTEKDSDRDGRAGNKDENKTGSKDDNSRNVAIDDDYGRKRVRESHKGKSRREKDRLRSEDGGKDSYSKVQTEGTEEKYKDWDADEEIDIGIRRREKDDRGHIEDDDNYEKEGAESRGQGYDEEERVKEDRFGVNDDRDGRKRGKDKDGDRKDVYEGETGEAGNDDRSVKRGRRHIDDDKVGIRYDEESLEDGAGVILVDKEFPGQRRVRDFSREDERRSRDEGRSRRQRSFDDKYGKEDDQYRLEGRKGGDDASVGSRRTSRGGDGDESDEDERREGKRVKGDKGISDDDESLGELDEDDGTGVRQKKSRGTDRGHSEDEDYYRIGKRKREKLKDIDIEGSGRRQDMDAESISSIGRIVSLAGKGGKGKGGKGGEDYEDKDKTEGLGGAGALARQSDAGRETAGDKGAAEKKGLKGRDASLTSVAGRGGREGKIPRVGSIEVVTQSQFHQLEQAVLELQKAGPMAAPIMPENKQLLEDISQGKASLTDVIQALLLQARLQAAERAIDRMADLIAQLAAAGALTPELLSKIADIRAEVAEGYKDVPLGPGGKTEQVKQLRKRLIEGTTRADYKSERAGGSARPSQLPGIIRLPTVSSFGGASAGAISRGASKRSAYTVSSEDCITAQEMEDALAAIREKFDRTVEALTMRANNSAEHASQVAKTVASQFAKAVTMNNRVSSLLSLVNDYTTQLHGFDSGVDSQIKSFQQQLNIIRQDLQQGLHELDTTTNNAETAAVLELKEQYQIVAGELAHTLHTHEQLLTNQEYLTSEVKNFAVCIEELRDQKVDSEEVIDALRDKADLSRLAGLLTVKEFTKIYEELQLRIQMCDDKFRSQEAVWVRAVREINEVVSVKAELSQVNDLEDEMQKQIQELNRRAIVLTRVLGKPKAAVITRRLTKGEMWPASAQAAMMEIPDVGATKSPRLPAFRPRPTGADDMCYRDEGPPLPKLPLDEDESQRPHFCKRWCGGSHTLLSSTVTRENAPPFTAGDVGPTRRYMGLGTDNQLYKMADPCQPCEECNVVEKIPGETEQPSPHPGAGDQGAGPTGPTVVTGMEARRITIVADADIQLMRHELARKRRGVGRRRSSSSGIYRPDRGGFQELDVQMHSHKGYEDEVSSKFDDIGVTVKGRITVLDDEAARPAPGRCSSTRRSSLAQDRLREQVAAVMPDATDMDFITEAISALSEL